MSTSNTTQLGDFHNSYIVDTHAHLDSPDYADDLEMVIARANAAGVHHIITVGTDVESSKRCVDIAEAHPSLFAAVGIHPNEVGRITKQDWNQLQDLAGHPKVVAIGETGLDYYRDRSPREAQQEAFRRHIDLAAELSLPIVVHNRDATTDCMMILRDYAAERVIGVMHCYAADTEIARECFKLGFFVSFAGPLTFPKADHTREVAGSLPLERLLLETDCPYLAPQSKRGKRNEPAYLPEIVESLADINHLSPGDVARITSRNAFLLFGIGGDHEESRIAYPIRDSLYLNITNRCTSSCTFCVRQFTPYVKGHHLQLRNEPDEAAILKAIGDPTVYDEITFCGYGEPTLRLETVKSIARYMQDKGCAVRLVTNGHANLIHGRQICMELKGLVDRVSVSLNTAVKGDYEKLCRPDFGADAFDGVLQFIEDARDNLHYAEITALDMPGIDIEKCRNLAEKLGVHFRLRRYNEVG